MWSGLGEALALAKIEFATLAKNKAMLKHLEDPVGGREARVANTLVGLAFAAILWWAQNEGVMSASEALHASLKALQIEEA